MTNVGYATFGLIPSAKGLGKAIDGEVLPAADRSGKAGGEALGGSLVAAAKRYAAPLAAAVGFGALIKTGFEEANDAAAGSAQLAAGIASTGNAANVSVDSLNALASEIQLYSGQTDDSIVASEKLLLTFTNIKNVGPDKIFDRATKATADMAARMGGDASASAVQLGKALNDPIAGISSLSRVGVQFTEEQKSMIKTLVDSGDTIGAQKIILSELETQFGGSAAAAGQTFPGQVQILKRSFEDFAQSIIGRVLPALTPFVAFLSSGLQAATAKVDPILNAVSSAMATVFDGAQGALKILTTGDFNSGFFSLLNISEDSPLVNILLTVRDAAISLWATAGPIFSQIGSAVLTAFSPLLPVLAGLIPQFISLATSASPLMLVLQALAPVLPQIASTIGQLAASLGGALSSALAAIIPAVAQVAQVLGGALSQVLATLVPVIAQVATTLGGTLGTVLTTLAPIIAQIASTLGTVLSSALTALMPLVTMIATLFGQVLTAIMPLITAVLGLLAPILSLISPLVQLVGAILTPLIQLFSVLLEPILALITPLVSLLTPALQFVAWVLEIVITAISTAIQWIADLVTGSGDAGNQLAAIWNSTMGMFADFFSNTFGMFSDFISNTVGMFVDFGAKLWAAAQLIWSTLTSTFQSGIDGVVNFFTGLPGQILAALGNVGNFLFDVGQNIIQGLMDGINAMAQGLADVVLGPIRDAVNGVKSFLGIASPSKLFRSIGQFTAQGMALGIEDGAGAIVKASDALIPTTPSYTAPAMKGGVTAAMAAALARGDGRPPAEGGDEIIQVVVDGKVIAEAVRKHDRSLK